MAVTLKAPTRKLKSFSASQVETYRRCKRLWYFQKVFGVSTPPSASQALGTEIHAAIEAYLTGQPVPAKMQKFVDAAAEVLPSPGAGLLVENEFRLDVGDLPLIGFEDLLDERSASEGVITVVDHKTTKDFKYAKTPDELRVNTQAIVYAKHAFVAYPQIDKVVFTHNYIHTKKPEARLSSVAFTREQVDIAWAAIVADTEAMVKIASEELQPLDVPGSADACSSYGGCFFMKNGACPDMEPKLIQLKGNKKGAGPMTEKGSKLLAKLAEAKAKREGVTNVPVAAQPPETLVAEPVQSILPPDAPSRDTTPEELAAALEETSPTKKKRAAQKKAMADLASPKESSAAPEEAPPSAEQAARTPMLFVGAQCMNQDALEAALGASIVSVQPWLDPLFKAINEEFSVADWGLIDYNKGVAVLRAAINQEIHSIPPLVFVHAMSPAATPLIDAFLARRWPVINKVS